MNNIPKAKVGIVAVSRDCFPAALSQKRREALIAAYTAKYDKEDIYKVYDKADHSRDENIDLDATCFYTSPNGRRQSTDTLADRSQQGKALNISTFKQCRQKQHGHSHILCKC